MVFRGRSAWRLSRSEKSRSGWFVQGWFVQHVWFRHRRSGFFSSRCWLSANGRPGWCADPRRVVVRLCRRRKTLSTRALYTTNDPRKNYPSERKRPGGKRTDRPHVGPGYYLGVSRQLCAQAARVTGTRGRLHPQRGICSQGAGDPAVRELRAQSLRRRLDGGRQIDRVWGPVRRESVSRKRTFRCSSCRGGCVAQQCTAP